MALTINHQTNDISATSGSVTIDGASAGASTTFGAVGTYVFGAMIAGRTQEGNTKSGSSIRIYGTYASNTSFSTGAQMVGYWRMGDNNLSGTWRMMFDASQDVSGSKARFGLWVRIS